jgi:hypothetical protein
MWIVNMAMIAGLFPSVILGSGEFVSMCRTYLTNVLSVGFVLDWIAVAYQVSALWCICVRDRRRHSRSRWRRCRSAQ